MIPTRCERCGAALLRVETLSDFALRRLRLVFTCGHSEYRAASGAWTPRAAVPRESSTGICGTCTLPFPRRSRYARKCDACLTPSARYYRPRATVSA